MNKNRLGIISGLIAVILLVTACQPGVQNNDSSSSDLKVIAVESFLADLVQNVAGDRVQVETLIPQGLDPHSFEPTPKDVAQINDSDILFINGAGLEEWLVDILENLPADKVIVEASAGLESRPVEDENQSASEVHGEDEHHEMNPHFWLDPNLVQTYIQNIRDALISIDPAGSDIYTTNADNYIKQLQELDTYIKEKVSTIPQEKRLIVTNHESFGYFADRYGFTVVGTIIHSVSTGSSPSAQQLAELVDQMRATGAMAIFMETGSNSDLADQLSAETGIKVVYDLYTHSTSPADGPAATYIDLMKYNVDQMVKALGE
jgi:ABC-type Zn uptake system ZnuABC Zn-binding protein ZnuA